MRQPPADRALEPENQPTTAEISSITDLYPWPDYNMLPGKMAKWQNGARQQIPGMDAAHEVVGHNARGGILTDQRFLLLERAPPERAIPRQALRPVLAGRWVGISTESGVATRPFLAAGGASSIGCILRRSACPVVRRVLAILEIVAAFGLVAKRAQWVPVSRTCTPQKSIAELSLVQSSLIHSSLSSDGRPWYPSAPKDRRGRTAARRKCVAVRGCPTLPAHSGIDQSSFSAGGYEGHDGSMGCT